MKKSISFLLLVFFVQVNAQNPTYQEKLFYSCKIWGFVKYFHSDVSTCSINWDSVLVSRLPFIKNSITFDEFNNEMDTLLNLAGPMNIATDAFEDSLPTELKRNLDFSWFTDPILRNDVKSKLDTIKNNFRPHPICWVRNNDYTGSYIGWLDFTHDNLMQKDDICTTFPNEYTRLLFAFKYWNILHYFNPYNYVLDTPSDSSLYKKILLFANATNCQEYYLAIKKMAKDLDDAHAEGLTACLRVDRPYYYYTLPIILLYTQQKYIVAKTTLDNINVGDAILSINGLSPKKMEDSLRPYISSGDSSVFHRFMCRYILNGVSGSNINIVTSDIKGNKNTLNLTRNIYINDNWFNSYFPNDSLETVSWKKFDCNVGYVNMGKIFTTEIEDMYNSLRVCSAIIFDIRNYPNGTAWAIANKMYPERKIFSKGLIPNVLYPGTFFWYNDSLGENGNATPFNGKVIILMNQNTQSQAEYSCMILENMANSIKIGSQTAGADGNISYFKFSTDIQVGFTNLGIYYPNGDSTQRIGIKPDTLVYPTQEGITMHRDEVLEKALEIASCITSIEQTKENYGAIVNVYPNPSSNICFIESNITDKLIIDLYEINGRHIMQKILNKSGSIDVNNLRNGVYSLTIQSGNIVINKKLIIIH